MKSQSSVGNRGGQLSDVIVDQAVLRDNDGPSRVSKLHISVYFYKMSRMKRRRSSVLSRERAIKILAEKAKTFSPLFPPW